jgi:uncharacterized protein (DUF362 family)
MTEPVNHMDPDRRDFLKRLFRAGAAAAVCGGLVRWRYRSEAPSIQSEPVVQVRLPDFSLVDGASSLAIVTGVDRATMLDVALKALNGIDSFIARGDRVLIKVNAAFASPPLIGATTHPELLAAMVRQCAGAGAEAVIVTDNPINDPASCFALSGIGAAAQEAGAELKLPQSSDFAATTLKAGALISNWPILFRPFHGVTKLIGMAPVKDHHRSGASMIMKNWYGLLGGQRNIFHQHIHAIIEELALLVKPTLVILDGTQSMVRNGPTGGSLNDLKPTHTLIVGTDQVAADSVGATLLGKAPDDLPFIGMAERAGVGHSDLNAIRVVRAQTG